MMPKTNNIPEVRFAGFTDAWEQRKLGEVATYRRGSFPQPYGKSEWYDGDGAMPFVQVADVSDEMNLVEETKQKISILAQPMSVFAEKNSVLVTLQGSIGRVAIMQYGAFVDRTVLIFEKYKAEIDKTFWAYIIKQKFIDEARKAPGGTIKTITKEALSDFDLSIPKYQEQKQIGAYFRNLDNLITLHQRKYERLKNVKKSMLEKMFPKNGSNIPEIRFAGFTDAWEQRKLSDLIIEYKETVDSDCTLPVLTSSKTEGVVLQEEHFGRVQNHDITGYNILPRNYCTYRNRSDGVDFTFNINRCCDKGIISKFYPVFYGNNSDIFFISMVLNYCDEVVHEIAYTCTGTGQKVLSFLDLQKMNIRVPSYDEQKKISQYFEQLDNLITLHQRKLEKLQNIKKSMLEKMFV